MEPDDEMIEEITEDEELAEVIELPTAPEGDAERRANTPNVDWDSYPLRP